MNCVWLDESIRGGFSEWSRGCRQFKNIGLQASVSVIPAKAGTWNPVAGKYAFAANGLWIPAFAGMTVNMTTLPRVTSLDSGECLVRLPFWDGEGDPIELTVAVEGGRAVINDTGSIAGLLFSLGQDHQGTPAFKLLENLAKAHNLEINFDDGLVQLSISEARFC